MKAVDFAAVLGAAFYTGVPDSLLHPLADYLMQTYGTDPRHHIVAANEGNAAALAAGYYLATGKVPVVYMQNSGEGNALNPIASLLHKKVYGIPMIFVIGWRGEPGQKDEPQHIFQGEITTPLLTLLEVPFTVLEESTRPAALVAALAKLRQPLSEGQSVAIVVQKGALTHDAPVVYQNAYPMKREEILRCILAVSGTAPIVATTGKTSREIFELRDEKGQDHGGDFLTVGSMGHSSSIALGIALQRPRETIWCIDGDGAALMHLGAMAVIGNARPQNLIHVVINNEVHESVGGLPTGGAHADLTAIAKACGYEKAARAETPEELAPLLASFATGQGLRFLEAKCAIGARADLGRPTMTPQETKGAFMEFLRKEWA